MNQQNMNQMDALYRQVTWQALRERGMTPGDIGQFLLQAIKNSGMTAGGEAKLGRSVMEQGRDDSANAHVKQQEENQKRFEEQKQQEAEIAKNRPAEDALNARYMGMPLKMTGALFGLGLTAEAVKLTGEILSPGFDGIGDQMKVIGNTTDGSMLNEARQALGANNPAQQDEIVTGPNQVTAFIPGQAPQIGGSIPGAVPGMDPRNPSMAAVPGMSGPSFGPT